MAKIDSSKLDFARKLRREQTDAEKKMWRLLRSRQLAQYKFRRQRVIGPYIADFCCLSPKLIVELDGGQHIESQERDQRRSQELERHGFKVIRFWDNDVLTNPMAVTETLLRALTPTLSHPSDGRGR